MNLAEKSHLHGMGSSYSQAVTELDLAIEHNHLIQTRVPFTQEVLI